MTLFFSAHLNIALRFQIRIDSQPIPAVVNDPLSLFVRESFDVPDLSIVGVNVVKLHLERGVFLDERNGLNVAIFKGFVVADVEHSQYRQHCSNQ